MSMIRDAGFKEIEVRTPKGRQTMTVRKFDLVERTPEGAVPEPRRPVAFNRQKSRTQQHQAERADINFIVARVLKSDMPILVSGRAGEAQFGDFTRGQDLQSALDSIQRVSELFMELPSEVREEFDNDPVELLEFLEDPANQEEALELGLLEEPASDAGEARESEERMSSGWEDPGEEKKPEKAKEGAEGAKASE